MDCEAKHKDMKDNITKLFDLVGGRVKWYVFAFIVLLIVGASGETFRRVFKTQDVMAQEHKEMNEKHMRKDEFKEFKTEYRQDMKDVKQLIREISK
jgi:hypothetical protein